MPRAVVVPKPATLAQGLRVSSPTDTGQNAATPIGGNRPAFEQGQMLAAVEDLRRQLNQCPLLAGAPFPSVQFGVGEQKTIAHGLKRQPQGYFPTRIAGGAPDLRWIAWDAKTIVLKNFGAGAITVDLWVY